MDTAKNKHRRNSEKDYFTSIKTTLYYLFGWCNLTRHFNLSYHFDSHTVSLNSKSSFNYFSHKVNTLLSFHFLFYHSLQAWRCLYIYHEKKLFLVLMCWVCGLAMSVFGHVFNCIFKKHQRVNTFLQVFKFQQYFFRKNKNLHDFLKIRVNGT